MNKIFPIKNVFALKSGSWNNWQLLKITQINEWLMINNFSVEIFKLYRLWQNLNFYYTCDRINKYTIRGERKENYENSGSQFDKNVLLIMETFNSNTTRCPLLYRTQLERTCIYLTYVNPPALLTPRKKGEWNISHRDFRSLKRRIARGVPEKRNFSCRITLRRKEEKEAT